MWHAQGVLETRPDCSRCQGLCCVALPFFASESFPVDKAAGEPCRNLARDHRCTIHSSLADRGWIGCTVFDCFGAGQHVASVTYAGRTWHDDAQTRQEMFEVFPVMHQLFEMLFHLEQLADHPVRDEVIAAIDTGQGVLDLDVAELRSRVGAVLSDESTRLRSGRGGRAPAYIHPRADLAGRDLRGVALAGADLRGSLLIGVDLRGADLAYADLLGADLRGARVGGALLAEALFLSQSQLNGTRGDARTTIPARLARPGGWER
ncbi:pentapeptide repeat-containing protein [Mariniluteicoccus flavus]